MMTKSDRSCQSASSSRSMQRMTFRWSSRSRLPAAALAVAALVGCGALTYVQVVHVPQNRSKQESVVPKRPQRPIGGVGGFTTIQAALDATASEGTLTF